MNDQQRTLTTAEGSFASVQVRAASIDVRSGPSAGLHVRVESPRFVIGSSEGADLRLNDKTVSREHVTLTLTPEGLVARDEGSRNGTLMGAVRIREVLLCGDAMLRVGNTTLAITVDNAMSDIPVATTDRFGAAIGISTSMRHVFYLLERAASTDVTVLLEGESGVGKEVLARAVHDASGREGPFVAVDCGAIPAGLFESELFGHVRGAFTGAGGDRVGLAEQADGGTLFLDEIGELPIDLQPKLLRVLEQREVRPVGGTEVRKIDVRVVAATNRSLVHAVESGTFREDLFYRLAVARVVVPPLRDRTEDIEPIGTMLLRKTLGDGQAELDPEIVAMLRAYKWPGNVRELKNVIDRHVMLGVRDRRGLFDRNDQPELPTGDALWGMSFHDARKALLDDFERTYLQRVLQEAGGAASKAIELSGIPRPTFYRLIARLGLKPKDQG